MNLDKFPRRYTDYLQIEYGLILRFLSDNDVEVIRSLEKFDKLDRLERYLEELLIKQELRQHMELMDGASRYEVTLDQAREMEL